MAVAAPKRSSAVVALNAIAYRIHLIRGQRVMLSTDLTALYDIEPRMLVQAVKRNLVRFPEDFMFHLTREEAADLKSQSVISKDRGRGGRRYAPYAFTEQGVAMRSSVLSSARAVAVNIEIMRAFVRLRQLLATHAELAQKLVELERKYDARFRVVFDAIRQLMEPVEEAGSRPEIGFR